MEELIRLAVISQLMPTIMGNQQTQGVVPFVPSGVAIGPPRTGRDIGTSQSGLTASAYAGGSASHVGIAGYDDLLNAYGAEFNDQTGEVRFSRGVPALAGFMTAAFQRYQSQLGGSGSFFGSGAGAAGNSFDQIISSVLNMKMKLKMLNVFENAI